MTLEIGRGWPRVGERAAKAAGDLLANHTLVVGQSRSGKSTAVRRIIEEVLLKTSARVVVLDPNSAEAIEAVAPALDLLERS